MAPQAPGGLKVSQPPSALFGSDVTLRLAEKFVTDHELLDGR